MKWLWRSTSWVRAGLWRCITSYVVHVCLKMCVGVSNNNKNPCEAIVLASLSCLGCMGSYWHWRMVGTKLNALTKVVLVWTFFLMNCRQIQFVAGWTFNQWHSEGVFYHTKQQCVTFDLPPWQLSGSKAPHEYSPWKSLCMVCIKIRGFLSFFQRKICSICLEVCSCIFRRSRIQSNGQCVLWSATAKAWG